MRKYLLLASLLALPVASLTAADSKQKPDPQWALSWEAALAEAKDRNVPIFFTSHQDG